MSESSERLQEVADRLVEAVAQANGGVSFVEIEQILRDEGIEYRGDYELVHPCHDTISLWIRMSAEFVEIMELANDRIEPKTAPSLIYAAEHKVPRMPVATREYDYRSQHWMPVCWYLRSGV